MCSSSTMSTKFLQKQLFLFLATLLLAIAVGTSADDNRPKELTFVPWGQRCKIANKGESLKPNERCDESRGIVCQKYTQGEYCGCRLEGAESVSYDHGSKECRLNVGQFCHFVNATAFPDYFARLPFNTKCHERAECKSVRLISKQENHKKSDDTTCMCKEGYIPSRDLSQCEDPNSATSTTANRVLCGLDLLFVSVKHRLIL